MYAFSSSEDREIVGFLASALAYGRVTQILNSVSRVLRVMGTSPHQFLLQSSWASFQEMFAGFSHRFATGEEISALLVGAGGVINRYGSLQAAFLSGYSETDETILPALSHFVSVVMEAAPSSPGHLLPQPERGSACKRLNLFLRWMVRRDAVDPGEWRQIPPSRLIIPLDTHMHRVGLNLGFTGRKQGDMKTALEITNGFKAMVPEDPVRYDFVLTRLGVWGKTQWLER